MKPRITTLIIGPLFTLAERDFNVALATALERQGRGRLTVTLPQIETEKFRKGDQDDLEATWRDRESNVVNHEVVIAILDGADCDSGTCYELGYRVCTGGITIGVRTDFRQSESGSPVNAMLTGVTEMVCLSSPEATVVELATRIIQAIDNHRRL